LLRVMRSHGVVDGTVLCNTYIVVLEGRTCNNNLLLVAVKLGLVLRNLRSPVLNFQHESLVVGSSRNAVGTARI
jgi:hypothetical protein